MNTDIHVRAQRTFIRRRMDEHKHVHPGRAVADHPCVTSLRTYVELAIPI
jgi:hypothetical protein